MELNTTQCALIHLKLDADSFEEFHFDDTDQKELVIGIHTDNFLKILKTLKHDETLSFLVKKDEPNFIIIRKENDSRNSTNSFKIPMHTLEFKNYEIPSIEFNTMISMASGEFQRICKNFSSLGAKVLDIKNIKDGVFFNGSGDFCTFEGVLGDSTETTFKNISESIVQGAFDIKYLLLFSKASSLSKIVNIYLKNDYPLVLTYKVGTLGELKFIISAIQNESTS
jgi:proliferating cell nuclear antigen